MATTSCCFSSSSQEDYQNIMSNIVAVEAMSHIDELVSYIDQFLNGERKVGKTDEVDSSIKSAGVLLNKVLKRSKRYNLCKRLFKRNLNRETCKLMIDVTNQAAQIKWLGVALSVVAFVLERIEQVSSNTEESIKLLKYMCQLAKYIKQLDEHLPQQKSDRVLRFVVQGSAICISQIKSDALSKCLAAPVMAEDLQSLRRDLELEYQDLELGAMIAVLQRSREILNSIPLVLPPSQGIPPQAVGTEEPTKCVIQLLNMESRSVIALVIYGQGGIGKTTLATAVFTKLDLQNYKFCRVDMQQDCKEADLKFLQEQILRDLFDLNIALRSVSEGWNELSKHFKIPSSKPVFIIVDNALKESDLEKLLPIADLTSLPPKSRILITTRNLNETNIILQARIKRSDYQVPFLPPEEAHKLLCKFALGSRDESFDATIDIKGLLQICQGIPLLLKLGGGRLCEHAESVAACRETVEYLKSWLLEGEKGEISERMVDFVYDRLGASCKEAFLVIVFFFCNWKRRKVASSVGETELKELEKAALVNITDKRRVNVHDIVQARGRKLSPDGERITHKQSLIDVLQNEERIQKTKGLVLPEEFELEARHLNSMKRCLRVLIASGRGARIVNGECKGAFENLRLLGLNGQNYSLMDVSKHPRLAVFTVEDSKQFEFSCVASVLKYMYLRRATLANVTATFSQLQSLSVVKLLDCRGFNRLPETIGNLPALQKWEICGCPSLARLPDSFCQLHSLSHLRLDRCRHLSALPESFGNLASLELLTLSKCRKLSNLPQNFGQLKRLKYLSIYGCRQLQSLSVDFECLSSLIVIKASECCRLEGNTMDKLAKMKGLMIADIRGSSKLKKRWEQVKEHYSLAVVSGRLWEQFLEASLLYEDVMSRVFFHSESKFVHVDENGQFGESGSVAVGVKLCVLFTVCDLTSPPNRGYLEAVKKEWEEAGSGSKETQMMYVDMGGSWEENERRVREILPHLPRGSMAWIAPDNRARLLFAYCIFKPDSITIARFLDNTLSIPAYNANWVAARISTSVDEKGNRNVRLRKLLIPDYTLDFEDAHMFDQLFSPISDAIKFLLVKTKEEVEEKFKTFWRGVLKTLKILFVVVVVCACLVYFVTSHYSKF